MVREKIKLFFISWTIPPSQGGSAYITHQLLKNFKHDEFIAVGGTGKLFRGFEKYEEVTYHYLFSEINWRGHGDRFFAPLRFILFPVVFFNAWSLARKNKPDAILATFPDGYYLCIGYLLSVFLRCPLYSYFHNTYSENRTGFSRIIATFLQRRVFKKSDFIFTMSEGMLKYYISKYPLYHEKFKVLPHTFNDYPARNISMNHEDPEHPIRLVFIGTINQSNLDASRRFFAVISKNPSRYTLDIYSSSNKNLLKYKYGLDLEVPGIRHRGVVGQEEINSILQNYDMCLLTHGFSGDYNEIEYQTIFPTRTIPFLLSGKPIIAHSPPSVFLTQFLKERDCAEVIDVPDEKTILKALDQLVKNKERQDQLIRNQLEAVRYFYGPEVVARFKSMIM